MGPVKKRGSQGHGSVVMTCIGYFEKCHAKKILSFLNALRGASALLDLAVSLQVSEDSEFHSLVYVSPTLCSVLALNTFWYTSTKCVNTYGLSKV